LEAKRLKYRIRKPAKNYNKSKNEYVVQLQAASAGEYVGSDVNKTQDLTSLYLGFAGEAHLRGPPRGRPIIIIITILYYAIRQQKHTKQ